MDDSSKRRRVSSIRLDGYNYGQNGAYFVTICTKKRELSFGEIVKGENTVYLQATEIGNIAKEYWKNIPQHFPFVILDEFTIMPNHVHGIIVIDKKGGDELLHQIIGYKNRFGPQSKNLSSIIRGYKAGVTTYAKINGIDFKWQARFYDRIIRDGNELQRIRNYIIANPDNWLLDKDNLENLYM
jgi:putative transposase